MSLKPYEVKSIWAMVAVFVVVTLMAVFLGSPMELTEKIVNGGKTYAEERQENERKRQLERDSLLMDGYGIYYEYNQNWVAADKKYLSKKLKLHVQIDVIRQGMLGHAVVIANNEQLLFSFYDFLTSNEADYARLVSLLEKYKPGDIIYLEAVCNGWNKNHVSFSPVIAILEKRNEL
jgi:hypothetical protein